MTHKPILQTLKGHKTRAVWWLMRQAGRYLPEYRELRAKAGGFLDMVYNPERACEVTMQPLRRFGMDAAILFSDILVIPQALGQGLKFSEGEGPLLDALTSPADIDRLDGSDIDKILSPVYETVERVAGKLKEEKFSEAALIGFCGAPWTIACYMIEGKGSRDFQAVKSWAVRDPESFSRLIDLVTQASIHYLSRQVEAGAEALQIFDSWAGIADEHMFSHWIIEPTRVMATALKEKYPHVPLIGFPRGAGEKATGYFEQTGVDAIGLDYGMSAGWARDQLQPHGCVQGNMDPAYLLQGGAAMARAAENILTTFSGGPFVFNLGHGVIKETDPEHVARLGRLIREFKP